MLFHTLNFIFFFLIALLAYSLAPRSWKRCILLAASIFFYAYWNYRVALLLLLTATINYFIAILLENSRDNGKLLRARIFLTLGICSNLLLLSFFKYYNFFGESFGALLTSFGLNVHITTLRILLPVGISFYTFELVSYLIDVWRGQRAERSAINLLLFATYFPKMMAGPIARSGQLIPQFQTEDSLTNDSRHNQIKTGLILFSTGLFKKVVIADNLAVIVNRLVGNSSAPTSLAMIPTETHMNVGTLCIAGSLFAIQIYADFSGYSAMARGMSRILGIELVENFTRPFLSTNPVDFWRRWHITLGTFFRDYVYIPLGGNRVSAITQLRNVMIVWTLGGLWHGATAGYFFWGLYCGAVVAIYLMISKLRIQGGSANDLMSRSTKTAGAIVTFLSFAVGLMIFRLGSPLLVLQAVITPGVPLISFWEILIIGICISPMLLTHIREISGNSEPVETTLVQMEKRNSVRFYSLVIGMIFVFILLGRFQAEEFFYFQF